MRHGAGINYFSVSILHAPIGVFVYANPKFEQMFGYEREQFLSSVLGGMGDGVIVVDTADFR
jgi:PAS domain